jgi:hypothetical protein
MRSSVIQLLIAGSVISALLSACTDPSDVGLNVQPASDSINVLVTDTLSLDVEVIEEDSLRTDEGVASLNLIGRYFDPVFGVASSSLYTQFRLPNNTNNFSFGDSPVLDSVVLTLQYKGYYGDSVSTQMIEVLRLDEDLAIDSNYFSNSTVMAGQQLFSGMVEIRPKDSVDLGGVNRTPHLRLHLDDAIGQEFIDDANAGSFVDNDAFIQFFKGVRVRTTDVPGSGDGSIAYIDLLASLSKFTVYYSNNSADSLEANFEVNGFCPRFSAFEQDYTMASFGQPPLSGNNKAYIQSMSGLKTRITIPNLKNLVADGPVSINKAEMVFTAEEMTDEYSAHEAALLLAVDSTGKDVIIIDLLESAGYYGGTYNSTDKTIRFNIGRHIQRILSNDLDDYGLSLVGVSAATNASRTVLVGPDRLTDRMYLRITYSKLN